MENNRLKLYNDIIQVCISKKEKDKFRKLAFRNKKTISEYIRYLIKMALLIDELHNNNNKKEVTNFEINKLLSFFGRDD